MARGRKEADAASPAPRRAGLTRERVLRAALELVDREGLAALTMRRLAAALGVKPMSLYSHVRDKDALVEGVLEVALAELEPPPRHGRWDERLRAGALAFRKVLAAHPNVLPAFATTAPAVPGVMKHAEPGMEALREAGLDEDECLYAFDSATAFIVGFSLAQWGGPSRAATEQVLRQQLVRLARLPADRFPALADIVPAIARYDMESGFEFGLSCFLEGLKARARGRGKRRARAALHPD